MRSTLLATAVAAVLATTAGTAHAAAPQSAASQQITAQQLADMKAQIAALQAQLDELQTRTDAQSDINVANAKTAEDATATQDKLTKLSKLVNDTQISGRMYYDASNLQVKNKVTDKKADNSGFGFDIKRFYLGVDHKFNDVWSMNLTTDFQYSSGIGATELYVKKAYVQGKFSDMFTVRAGAADLPWVPYAENAYGYRYIENTIADRLKFATSSDWGIHALGQTSNGMFNYAVAVVDGAGYKAPGDGSNNRSKGVDFEGRIGFNPIQNLTLAAGYYTGKRAKDIESNPAEHTASRTDALIAYATPKFRIGGEWFQADNYNTVQGVAREKADGYSVFGNVALTDGGVNVFARYDQANLNTLAADPSMKQTYYNLGVEFPITKGLKLAPVYKYTHQTNNARTTDLETSEVGVWGEFRF